MSDENQERDIFEEEFGGSSGIRPLEKTKVTPVKNIDMYARSESEILSPMSLKSATEHEFRTETENEADQSDRFAWLLEIRDKQGNLRGSENYDPRTLYIPPDEFDKLTNFEKQYWEIKSDYFDTIVFFKKGKFYELYEEDAEIGRRVFDLRVADRVNMKMAGVPESSFDFWASKFLAAGYKIARVDQDETAIGKAVREKESSDINKKEKIIKRSLNCVLTNGTLSDLALVTQDQSCYCVSLKEKSNFDETDYTMTYNFSLVCLDASTSSFRFYEFDDDSNRSKLQTLASQIDIKELLFEKV